jgi:hypothetical protein
MTSAQGQRKKLLLDDAMGFFFAPFSHRWLL